MYIQPISLACSRKPHFTSGQKRKENVDRAVTLQDLYEMEDRIKSQNSNLFAKQNRLIGKALDNIARVVYLTPELDDDSDIHEAFDLACENARVLINNGKNSQ